MREIDAFIDKNVLLYLIGSDWQKTDMAEAIVASGGGPPLTTISH